MAESVLLKSVTRRLGPKQVDRCLCHKLLTLLSIHSFDNFRNLGVSHMVVSTIGQEIAVSRSYLTSYRIVNYC